MEVTSPNLLNYIKIYDQILDDHTLDVFLRICKEEPNFNDAGLANPGNEQNLINKNIRDVKAWNLVNIGEKSRTKIFWANYFSFKINECIRRYFDDNNLWSENNEWSIKDIQVLKYEKNGKYNRKKIESSSGLVEKEIYKEHNVGDKKKKKGVLVVLD